MPIGATIGSVVAGVGSSLIGASASNKAAKAQAAAANKAQQTQLEMYRQTREDLSPFRDVGTEGAYSLADMFGFKTPKNPDGSTPFAQQGWENFQKTPYYQVPYKEGMDAIDNSAAARGNLLSSGNLKNLSTYAGNFASKQFGSYMDRLYQLAGMGGNAAATTGNAALSTGKGVAGSQMAAGEAQASGIVGSANAINSGLQGIGNNLAYLGMGGQTGGWQTTKEHFGMANSLY